MTCALPGLVYRSSISGHVPGLGAWARLPPRSISCLPLRVCTPDSQENQAQGQGAHLLCGQMNHGKRSGSGTVPPLRTSYFRCSAPALCELTLTPAVMAETLRHLQQLYLQLQGLPLFDLTKSPAIHCPHISQFHLSSMPSQGTRLNLTTSPHSHSLSTHSGHTVSW